MASIPEHGAREHRMVQHLRQELLRLSPTPDHILVGYSGGADSLSLLLLLSALRESAGVRVTAVHVDHGVRSESGADAALAATVCERLRVDLIAKCVDPDRLAEHCGVGVEESLRRERYRCFAEALGESRADLIALAHHQSDQAETVLLHLLRGAGLTGASGMRVSSRIHVPWWEDASTAHPVDVAVWRPFLTTFVESLRSVAFVSGMPIAEDTTNADESLRRNAIRHSALPLLERIVPGATSNLARSGTLAAIDDSELDIQAESGLRKLTDGDGLLRSDLLELPIAIRTRVLRKWIAGKAPASLELSHERIEAILAVAATPGGRRLIELGTGTTVEVARTRLRVLVQPFT